MAGEVELVAAAASLVVAMVAILGYLLNRRQIREARERTATYIKRVEVAEKELELNKANLKLVEKAVGAVMAIAESQKKQVEALLRQAEQGGAAALERAIIAAQDRQADHQVRVLRETAQNLEVFVKRQRELAEKQRTNWNILTGIAKALGWAYDRGLIGGVDESDENDN